MRDQQRDVRRCAGVEVEHVRPVRGIPLFPADVRDVVDHAGAVVALVETDTNQLFLAGFPARVPGVEESGGAEAHAVLGVAAAM